MTGISTADIIHIAMVHCTADIIHIAMVHCQVWSSLQYLVDLCARCYGSGLVHIARATTLVITGTTDSH